MGKKIRSDSIFQNLVPALNKVKIIYLPGFLFSTGTKTNEKNGKKVEKKVFLTVYPGLKSEFLSPKTFLKNFIYAFKTPVK